MQQDVEVICEGCRAPFTIMGGKLARLPDPILCPQCDRLQRQKGEPADATDEGATAAQGLI